MNTKGLKEDQNKIFWLIYLNCGAFKIIFDIINVLPDFFIPYIWAGNA